MSTGQIGRRAFLSGAVGVGSATLLAACGGPVPTATSAPAATKPAAASTPPAAVTSAGQGATTPSAFGTQPAAPATGAPTAAAATKLAAGAISGPVATEAPAAAAPSGSAAGTVTYWHTFFEQLLPALDQITKGFQAANPSVKLNIVAVPQPDFATKITTAVQAGTVPDVAVPGDSYYDLIAMKALEDVSARQGAWADAKDVLPAAWQGVTVGGKIYAVPAFMFVDWMYYRKDWFDEVGIGGPPADWNAFLDACRKLTDAAKTRYGFGMRGGAGGETYPVYWMLASGAELLDKNGKVQLDTPEGVAGFQWYTDLFTKEKVVPPSAPNDAFRQIIDAFKANVTGMIIHHTGSLAELTGALRDKVMTMPIPKGPAKQVAFVSPGSNAMFAGSKQKDAAWAWMAYWPQKDVQLTWLKASGYFPVINAVADDPSVKGNRLYDAAFATLKFAQGYPTWPGFNGWLAKSVRPHFQSVLVGKETAASAVKAFAADLPKAIS